MINGRLPSAGAAADMPLPAPAAPVVRPNKLFTLAAALPASEVRKNLRRDHNSIKTSAKKLRRSIYRPEPVLVSENFPGSGRSSEWRAADRSRQSLRPSEKVGL